MPISEQQIIALENFISSGEKSHYPAISICDLKYGKTIYNRIITESGPDYQIFGSDGCGYICYGRYKSKENKIYVVTATTNYVDAQNTSISSCILIDDEKWFGVSE